MTAIYFDLGNTRVKWKCASEAGFLDYSSLDYGLRSLPQTLSESSDIVFASVVKDDRRERFLQALIGLGKNSIYECVTTPIAAGVTCAYSDVTRLGVDRWLGVVAAWSANQVPILVVDLGTAATFDMVGRKGVHLGGYIVPGVQLGIASLLTGTNNVKVDQHSLEQASRLPGKNTTEAVCHGAISLMASAIEGSLLRLQIDYPEAKLVLTGGDADLVAKHLECQYQISGSLVFEGMQLMHLAGLSVNVMPKEQQ